MKRNVRNQTQSMPMTMAMAMNMNMRLALNIIGIPIIAITARSIINGEAILKAPTAHLHLQLHLRNALLRPNRLYSVHEDSIHGGTSTLWVRPSRH